MAASFGKMPTTSVRRLISPLRRSSGFVECSLVRCGGREGHVGEDVGFSTSSRRLMISSVIGSPRVRVDLATQPYRGFADHQREAARPLQRNEKRAAGRLRYRAATPRYGTRSCWFSRAGTTVRATRSLRLSRRRTNHVEDKRTFRVRREWAAIRLLRDLQTSNSGSAPTRIRSVQFGTGPR